MEKIFCLPKISIKQMEGRVKEQRSTFKRHEFQTEYTQNRLEHNREITITSPFYLRCEQKSKCECQFHRLKKQYLNSKKNFKSRTKIQEDEELDRTIEKYSPRKTVEKENEHGELYRKSITVQRIKNLSPIKLTQVLPSITPFREAPSNQSDLIFQPIFAKIPSRSQQKNPPRKTFKSFTSKPNVSQHFGEDTSCKIKAINVKFIKLISSRLQNEKYKQKYLKTLFGFIKYKTNYDRSYLYHSRAYLENSLNMLLNHFTMDKLLATEELTDQELKEIAYYMNCMPSKVRGVLRDLAEAVSQMERKLAEIKKDRQCLTQNENKEDSSTLLFNSIIQNHQNGTAISLEGQIDSLNTKNSILLDPLPSQDKNFTEVLESETNFMRKSQIQKFNIRKSSRLPNDFMSSSLTKKSGQNSKLGEDQSKHRNSRNTSQIIPELNKSMCSSLLGTVDECQQQLLLQKKRSGGKLRKTQKKEKLRLLSVDDKYSGVNYEMYISKKNFRALIFQIERIDINDSQRASAIFKALNIQSQVEDQSKIHDILATFKSLFNDKSLNHFLKEVVLVKDRRYIEKLERQLDSMLVEIKKNDPRIDDDLDFLQAKMRPSRKVHPLIGKMQHCNDYEKEKKEPINHIIYYEAEERIERHLTLQSTSKLHLEQAELRGVTLQSIDPSISKLISHHDCPAEQIKKGANSVPIGPIDHKKVLGYMKKHHQGAFNYLAQEFKQLNSYLHSAQQ